MMSECSADSIPRDAAKTLGIEVPSMLQRRATPLRDQAWGKVLPLGAKAAVSTHDVRS
jgi:hypothetical protein